MTIPVELFDRATRTLTPVYWTDERGFTYEVSWSPTARKALAHCISKPEGSSEEETWKPPENTTAAAVARDLVTPWTPTGKLDIVGKMRAFTEIKESLPHMQAEWNKVGRMLPGGYMDGDEDYGPTGWVEDGSLTAHPEDWEQASDPPTLFEGAGHDEGPQLADTVAKLWNRIPTLLRLYEEAQAEIKRLKRSL